MNKTWRMVEKVRALLAVVLLLGAWQVQAQAPLRVGTSADYPPLVFLKGSDVVGMEADLARLLGAQLRRQLQFKVMPAANLLLALEQGEIDMVMSGWRVTPERQQHADFVDGYVTSGLMAIIRTEDVMRYHNPAALMRSGYKLAVISAPEPSGAAAYVKANLSGAVVVPVDSSEAGLQVLLDKRADVFIDDVATSWNIATNPRYGALMSLGRLLTEERLAWAVRKNNGELRIQLNTALQSLRQTGVLDHVYNRWIPMSAVSEQ